VFLFIKTPAEKLSVTILGTVKLKQAILLTGVTGALGSALLPSLLQRFTDADVYCLVRGASQEDAVNKLGAVVSAAGLNEQQTQRVHLLQGDASAPDLGVSEQVLNELSERTIRIYHLAASVDFDASLEDSRRINVGGTQAILRFARGCRLASTPEFRLAYVSTAYIAGQRRGLIREDELDVGQVFWNSYEQSKFEAEQLVEQAKREIPITVLRPSQIIGDSRTGEISKFFGFYEFVALAVRGRSNILVADPEARPDMVPLDYVCDAILYLSCRSDSAGATYHLAAGLQRSLTVAEVVEAVLEVMRSQKQVRELVARPKIIQPERLHIDASPAELARYDCSAQKLLLRTYGPYLAYERDFDVAATIELLSAAGITLGPIRQAIQVTVDYALNFRARRRQSPPLNNKSHQLGETV
jgi:thioester reductase-like protein